MAIEKYDINEPADDLNPAYGNGVFRRRIRLDGSKGCVTAALEDGAHGFRSTVFHDCERVTEVKGESVRVPTTVCPGAVNIIRQLEGVEIGLDSLELARRVDPRSNCTHLFDLTALAIQHAVRGNSVRTWDVIVPDDDSDGRSSISVELDGQCLHRWTVSNWVITEHDRLCEQSLGKGFTRKLMELYSGDELDAALILQKGYLVSHSRRYLTSEGPISDHEAATMRGACYAYQPDLIKNARRNAGYSRDFSDTPEALLRFK